MHLIKQLAILCMMIFVFALPTDGVVDIAGMSLVKIFGLLGFSLTLLLIATGSPIKGSPVFYGVSLLYIAWVVFSFLWSAMPVDYVNSQAVSSQQAMKANLYLIVLIALLFQLVDNVEDINKLSIAFVLGSCWLAFMLIRDYDPSALTVRNEIKSFDSNEVTIKLAMAIPIVVYLFYQLKNPLLRWLPMAYLPLALYSIMTTGSRTGAVVMVIGLLGFIPLIWRSNLVVKAAVLVGLFFALTMIVSVIPERTLDRMLTVGSEISQGTLNERSVVWAKAREEWKVSPIVGQGIGSFRRLVNKYHVDLTAHNSLVAIAVEQGIIGVCLYLAVLFVAFLYAYRQRSGLGLTLISMLLIVVLGQMALTLQDRMHVWFAYVFVVLAYYLPQRDAPIRSAISQPPYPTPY